MSIGRNELYRAYSGLTQVGSPKPWSGGKQRSVSSLNKIQPWLDDSDFLELISNPGSGRGQRRFTQLPVEMDAVRPYHPDPLIGSFTGTKNSTGLPNLHRAVRADCFWSIGNLLDKGADINEKDRDGLTPLHAATRFERENIAKLLLERGADPTIPSNNEWMTPLHSAARRGNIEICGLLLQDSRVKAIVNIEETVNPFICACLSGSREVCDLFLKNGASLESSAYSYSALHIACFRGNEDVCELLLETASKQLPSSRLTEFIDRESPDGQTPLHYACTGGYEKIVDSLLRHGADRQALTLVASASPLHLAAKTGNLSVVELLVLDGAEINYRDGKLRTPLHSAATFNNCRIVELLLDSGADPEAFDINGMTPYLLSVTHGSLDAVRLLLERGVNITATDAVMDSALHLAIQYRKPEMVKMLLEMDKDHVLIKMKDNYLRTACHLAAGLETSEILEILLGDVKVCVRERDIKDMIPLHIAAEAGSLDCVLALSKLPEFVSLLNERDERAMSPLHLAASHGHTKTCELLISKGSDVTTTEAKKSTALHLAVKAGSLKTVQALLNSLLPSTLNERDLEENTSLHVACRYNRGDIAQFLLDKGADVTARNARSMTCLEIAIEWEYAEAAKTLVRHPRWEEVLQACPKTGVLPMTQLIEKLPDVAEIVLDNCVAISSLPPSHKDFSVTFNFRHLDPTRDCVRFVPAAMAKCKREKLLNHETTQAFLRYKWMVLGRFLTFFNTSLFIVFVIVYSWFAVNEREKSTLFTNSTSSANYDANSKATAGAIFVFVIVQLLKEVVQLSWLRLGYFKDATNLIELLMYGMVCVFIIPSFWGKEVYGEEMRWGAGLTGLWLSYTILTLHFRRFGVFGLYITMYREVLWTFVKAISTFLVTLIGFTLAFYILLGHQGNFSSFLFALGKIHVMMVGELGYTDMLVEKIINNDTVPGTDLLYVPLPLFTGLLFFVFVLMISVVLVNLLVGLAVGDIESIQRTANLRTLIDDALLIEGIMKSYPAFIRRRVHRNSLTLMPNRNSMIKRIAFAGINILDQNNFMDKLLRSKESKTIEEWCDRDKRQREEQERIIHKLQGTVEAQGKILRAMADRLNISNYDD
ncbi:transient receptor potential cation channel subfamily A member 1-like isoform X1 [Montipora capricornis]|uniref:transient receptor potential cation channel subfamily A member 1-like isoform X1 n=1 Tax=Montipora capricornis TaxID=246305 RepID=UPI0035F163BF